MINFSLHLLSDLYLSQEWPMILRLISMGAFLLLFFDWHVTPVAGHVVRPRGKYRHISAKALHKSLLSSGNNVGYQLVVLAKRIAFQ